MMSKIVKFFESLSSDVELSCFNQHLVGLFTSSPASRIVSAVDWMLRQFVLKYDVDPTTYSSAFP